MTATVLEASTRHLPETLSRLRASMLVTGWSAEYRPVPDPEAERMARAERADTKD